MRKSACFLFVLLLGLGSVLSGGCSNKESDEARQRVLDKKDLKEEIKNRKVEPQSIDLEKLGDIEELQKIILMTQEEIGVRLGSYAYDASVVYVTRREGKDVTMDEKQLFQQNGNGDYYLKIYNDKTQNFEMYWVGGQMYDRTGNSPFRQSTSTGKHLYWREKIYGTLSRFYQYFRGHLKFSAARPATLDGRDVLRIDVSLDPNGTIPEKDLPTNYGFPNQYALSAIATDKLLNKNRKRVSRFEAAEGYLMIDREKKALLAYELKGKYAVPISEKVIEKMKKSGVDNPGTEVLFTMDCTYKIKDIGKTFELKAPAHRPPVKRTKPPESVKPLLPKGAALNPELEEKAEGTETPEKTEPTQKDKANP